MPAKSEISSYTLKEQEKIKLCPKYIGCEAPLCPNDKNIKNRIWFTDEAICHSQKFNQRRWIKKQRKLAKKTPKKYIEEGLTYQDLYDLSRPKNLTDEQRQALSDRAKKMINKKLDVKDEYDEEQGEIIDNKLRNIAYGEYDEDNI